MGVLQLIDPSLAAVPLLLVSLGALVRLRGDYEKYSVLDAGVYKRVERRSVRSEGHECADCGRTIETGEHRRWYKEGVFGGIRLFSYGGGERRYCEDHASFDVRDDLKPVASFQRTDAVMLSKQSDGKWKTTRPDYGNSAFNDTAADDIVTATNSAFQLLPVAFLILFAAMCIQVVKLLGGLRE